MPNRREFLTTLFRAAFLTGLGVLGGAMVLRKGKPGECGFGFDCAHCGEADKCVIPHPFESRQMVWQLDPSLCTHCGQCATACVMTPSAVKCVHVYAMCGYCDLCGGYFKPGTKTLDTAAENQLCPTNAIKRKFVEEPFFEYTIDESLCIGCGKCVKGCDAFGNESLQLPVSHARCKNCNQCAIARICPAGAYRQVPARHPSLLRGFEQKPKNGDLTQSQENR